MQMTPELELSCMLRADWWMMVQRTACCPKLKGENFQLTFTLLITSAFHSRLQVCLWSTVYMRVILLFLCCWCLVVDLYLLVSVHTVLLHLHDPYIWTICISIYKACKIHCRRDQQCVNQSPPDGWSCMHDLLLTCKQMQWYYVNSNWLMMSFFLLDDDGMNKLILPLHPRCIYGFLFRSFRLQHLC